MKVIIAGSRNIVDGLEVFHQIHQCDFIGEITELVNGECPTGVDYWAIRWANHRSIPIKYFPANWTEYGRKAGPIRNGEMAKYADALIAIWDRKSRGTQDMIKQATRNNLRIHIGYVT